VKIDLYHLYRSLNLTNLAYPLVLDVLKVWAESLGWQARVSICKESKVNLSSDAEVVGFSVYTQTAPAVYRLAERLRRRGKIVILGGPHFRGSDTYLEASPYCDILVSSICEQQWKRLLSAIAKGKIRPKRQRPLLVIDRKKEFRYPSGPFQAFENQRWYQVPSVPTSLGCPYHCDFCSPYMEGEYFLREIDTIYNEVAQIQGKTMWICDATFGLNKRFTMELMRAIAPLRKTVVVETTLARLQEREIVKSLALGGVRWITAGIETLSSPLTKHGAGVLDDGLRDIVDCAHDCGIMVHGNFICGLDSDGPDAFDRIYHFYEKSKLDAVMVSILIPYPNTVLYHRLKKEGRIIDTNWEHFDKCHVVYQPKQMTIDQLIDGYIQLSRALFSNQRILRESFGLLKTKGVTLGLIAAVVYKVGFMLDIPRKKRLLGSDHRQLTHDRSGDAELSGLPDSTPRPL
jgi:radical SAM superfamily enzyme YgiQ (UPF0313 family)